MDLKNGRITVGELLSDPRSRSVLTRRFPLVLRKEPGPAGRTVTLEQLLGLVGDHLPRRKVEEALEELRRL